MKFTLATVPHGNFFTATDDHGVEIAGVRYTGSLIMAPDLSPEPWVDHFEELSTSTFEALLAHKPELVVVGTGKTFRFLHPRLWASLLEAGIGVEAMDTRAACRTYNVLIAEGRRALVVLLKPSTG
jgi:uncharacterized protein